MGVKTKIADSRLLNRGVEAVLAGWIRLAHATSTWETVGFEGMQSAADAGEPVIIVLWHQRVMMSPYLFDASLGAVCSLTSSSRAGQLAGNIVKRFGVEPIQMSSRQRHAALTRAVLRKIREGASIGLAADGPRGPARVASLIPVTWARAAGKRVFLVSFSARRVHALPTWDEMWLPTLFTRCVFHCQEWQESVPRFPDETETERLRLSLQTALDAVTDASDLAAGRSPKTS